MDIKKRLYLGFRLLFAIVVCGWVWNRFKRSNLPSEILEQHVPFWVFFVPTIIIALNTLVHCVRLWLLFRAIDKSIPFAGIVNCILKGHFVGLALPMGGGDLAKIGYLAAEGRGLSVATGMLGVARILELIPWGAVLTLGAAYLWRQSALFGLASVLSGLSMLTIAFGGLWLTGRRLERLAFGPRKFRQFVGTVSEGLRLLSGQSKVLWQVGLLGIIFLALNTLCLWILCWAYGTTLTFFDVLTVFPLVDLLVSLPISINGVGVRELVYPEVLGAFKMPLVVALSIAWTRWTGELVRGALGAVVFLRDKGSS